MSTNAAVDSRTSQGSVGPMDPRKSVSQGMTSAHQMDNTATLLFESLDCRVWKIEIPPRSRGSLHTNDLNHVVVCRTDGNLNFYDKDGKLCGSCAPSENQSITFNVVGDEIVAQHDKTHKFPKTHCVENASDKPYVELVMELCPCSGSCQPKA